MSTCAVVAMGLIAPAVASAATFTVNDLGDPPEVSSPCGSEQLPEECTLRSAIEQADETPEEDTIEFAVAGTIELTEPLPSIFFPVAIDATGPGGAPTVELDGSELPGAAGLVLEGSAGSRVEGLAIGGFDIGIKLRGDTSYLCANRIGVGLDGNAAPNSVGVRVAWEGSIWPWENEIGSSDCATPNTIAGNLGFGIEDEGQQTQIVGNRVGVGAPGDPLPNGSGGIWFGVMSEGARVFGQNVIAHNGGPGVYVEDALSSVRIFRNSIFANAGLGIEIAAGVSPQPPTISAVARQPAKVTGTVTGEPGSYAVDIYASTACDPSGAGEGQFYLGEDEVEVGESGVAAFEADELGAIPGGMNVITATSSGQIGEGFGERTSEFSTCFVLPQVPLIVPMPPPELTQQLIPENGETLLVAPTKGAVFVKLPGRKKFVRLREGQLIPVGAIVDATRGKVTLTSINKAGVTQTAVFSGGRFLVAQREGSGLVTLRLRGPLSCKPGKAKGKGKGKAKAKGSGAGASARRKAAGGKRSRRLWGSGKGRFRTQGNYGSATVRGTTWLTEDRCAGTFFKVRKGSVTVRDFPGAKTLNLNRGKSYLAKP